MTDTIIPAGIVAVADYESHARAQLDAGTWAYISGGVADERTLDWNRSAFDRLALRGRVLCDLNGGHTRLDLLGTRLPHPILIAPMGHQGLVHPEAEAATARAAAAVGALMVASTAATLDMETIAGIAAESGVHAPQWFQLYFQGDRSLTEALVARSEAAGYRALVVTVDAAINGVRNREQRAGYKLPQNLVPANLRHHPPPLPRYLNADESLVFDGLLATAPTWDDIAWLKTRTQLPVILKGITAAEDALLARDAGIDGIIVSNHGGRTLDTLAASIDLLPEIADAIGGHMPILLDGGIRRGTDILKALALGATAILVGRPILHALNVAGARGVVHVLQLLATELEIAMALTGCRTLADIGPHVFHRPRSFPILPETCP
jgi:4-hydroxymandelate oxidase